MAGTARLQADPGQDPCSMHLQSSMRDLELGRQKEADVLGQGVVCSVLRPATKPRHRSAKDPRIAPPVPAAAVAEVPDGACDQLRPMKNPQAMHQSLMTMQGGRMTDPRLHPRTMARTILGHKYCTTPSSTPTHAPFSFHFNYLSSFFFLYSFSFPFMSYK